MIHKTFLGLYRKEDAIPLEIKFIAMVGLCAFYAFNGFLIAKAIILIILLCTSIALGKKRSLKLIRILLLSCIALLFFWTVFFHGVTFHSIASDVLNSITSEEYANAVFRLFGLIIPGYIFMCTTSEQELLSTFKKYKAKPEIIIFFVVTFNTIAHFFDAYRTISFGYKMRIARARNNMKKLVHILTTLLFNCILLIMKTKKVYYLYEERIKKTITNDNNHSMSNIKKIRELTISISQVRFSEKILLALSDIKVTILPGQTTLLIGDVGSGKTTLLNIVAGIIPNIINCEYEGDVCLDGASLCNGDVDFVFQHSENSMFYDTVERKLSHIKETIRWYWLEQFKIGDLHKKSIADLSVGQRKMVSIISCLLSEVPICLLDEPTAHLDSNAIEIFITLIKAVCQDKIIIISSHDQSIHPYFNNIIQLGCSDFIDGLAEFSIEDDAPSDLSLNNEMLADIDHCVYKYPDGTVVFSDLSFKINKGEIIGLLGMNGSGKSTISRLIAEAATGRYKNNAIIIPQKCTVAMMLQDADMQFFTTNVLDELKFGIRFDGEIKTKIDELLRDFNLEHLINEPPQFLSEGQKKLLLVVCMLISKPDILILDEPFDSLDLNSRKAIRAALMSYIDWTKGEKSLIINDQNDNEMRDVAMRYINLPARHYKNCLAKKDV